MLFNDFISYLRSMAEFHFESKIPLDQIWQVHRFKMGVDYFPHSQPHGLTVEDRVLIEITLGEEYLQTFPVQQLGTFVDFLAKQYDFFKSKNCCAQGELTARAAKLLGDGMQKIASVILTARVRWELFYEHCPSKSLIPTELKDQFLVDPAVPQRNTSIASNYLLSMPKVPNWQKFGITKNPADNFQRTMDFVVTCQSLPCDLRIASWPEPLRDHITTQCKIYRLWQNLPVTADDCLLWQSLSPQDLIHFLQAIGPDTKGGSESYSDTNAYSRFTAYIFKNTIYIDFATVSNPANHPFTEIDHSL